MLAILSDYFLQTSVVDRPPKRELVLALEVAFTRGRLSPASPREKLGDVSWVGSTPRSPVPASV